MTLSIGTRLGPYEILSALGAGGMGEVFRARDTRLGRTVAIKVLHDHLVQDESMVARFEREALFHPWRYMAMTAALAGAGIAAWTWLLRGEQASGVNFEEDPEPALQTLGLSGDLTA